jgi:hypothetical protein
MDPKCLGSLGVRCWRRMEISCINYVRNKLLQLVKEERNIRQTIKRGMLNEFVTFYIGTAL